jgi:hypothetical protein
MSAEQFPRKVFQVGRGKEGHLVVLQRELLSRSRNGWSLYRTGSGKEVKDRGAWWYDTMGEAIHKEAEFIMFRFACHQAFSHQEQLQQMWELIEEAFAIGELVGEVNANKRRIELREQSTEDGR